MNDDLRPVDWWYMATLVVVALVLLAGCARQVPYSPAPLACQDQAVDFVWRQQYGRTDRPPGIWWATKENQTCGQTINGARGFMTAVGCAGGASFGASADVYLAWYGSWPQTALAHEFLHVSQARDGLPPDTNHSPAFMAVVNRTNAALAAAKLCGP